MDKSGAILWMGLYMFLYIALIVFISKNPRISKFTRGMFITGFSFMIFSRFIEFFTYDIAIGFMRYLFAHPGNLRFMNTFSDQMGYFLMIYGLTLIMGCEYPGDVRETAHPLMTGKKRRIGVSMLLFVVTFGIYLFFWLYRTVKDLKTNFPDEIPYTPGKAVGFMFIPILNIFWFLYIVFTLPLSMKEIEKKYFGRQLEFYFHPVVISVLLVVFGIGLNIVTLSMEYNKQFFEIIQMGMFFSAAGYICWLTLQAKLNAFFDNRGTVEPVTGQTA